ncbi:MAG: Sec-independent protein translocase protein TatB [Pseudomonadota bacterium]
MPSIGWSELLIVGIVALIVVGPRDLPMMFRNIGRFTGRLRGMARDFSRAMEDAADESGARQIARDLRTMSNPTRAGREALTKAAGLDDLDPFGEDDEGDVAPSPAKPATPNPSAAAAKGPHTAALAEERAAEARRLREDAAARANARATKGWESATADSAPAPAEATAPDAVPAEAVEADRKQDLA